MIGRLRDFTTVVARLRAMSVIRHVHFAVCLSLVCSGCRQATNSGYSEEHVRSVVTPGVSREEVERAFGQPFTTMPDGGGGTIAVYRVPDAGSVAFRDKFTGFQVRYSENRVEKWFPVYSDQRVLSSSSKESATQTQTNLLAGDEPEGILFFVVSKVKVDGGTYVNSPVLPELGYIAATPDLTFSSIESVVEGNEAVGPGDAQALPTLIIALSENDARALREYTESRVGKRVLICLGRRFLSAPYILSPIANGQLCVSFSDSRERDEVVRQLRVLARKP